MMMIRKFVVAAALMLVAGTAHAQQSTTVGNWMVFSNDDNCRALTTLDSGTMVAIALYRNNERTSMMILDNTIFAGVSTNAPFDASLAFLKGKDLISDWTQLPVLGVVLDNGAAGVFIESEGDGLLKTFGTSDVGGLVKGDDAVVSFKINPGPELVTALRKCVADK